MGWGPMWGYIMAVLAGPNPKKPYSEPRSLYGFPCLLDPSGNTGLKKINAILSGKLAYFYSCSGRQAVSGF